MKKILSVLLTLSMILSCGIEAFAATGPTVTYDLSCEGSYLEDGLNEKEYAKKGDVITVEYRILLSEASSVYVAQNEIVFDEDFFEFVDGSNVVTIKNASGKLLYETALKGNQINFNTINTIAYPKDTAVLVGTVQLRVIAEEGEGMVSNRSSQALYSTGESFSMITHDLHVSIGERKIPEYTISYNTAGGEEIAPVTVRRKTSVKLPSPVRQYYEFVYWTAPGDDTHYKAGASYTPTGDVTLTAVWSPVEAPERPSGLVGVHTTAPNVADGKIIGTTAKMEYSTTADFSEVNPCTDKETTGLAAGTYYVRVKADGNTPPGAYTAVNVVAGQIPDAPTGLTVLKTSQPGAKDGKIMGTTTAMEWSSTADFETAFACIGSEITGLAAGTYYVRIKADAANRTAAGNYATLSVPEGQIPAAPTGLTGVRTSLSGSRDGKITGTTTKMEWSTREDFRDARTCTSVEVSNLAAGVYYVRFSADSATNTCAGRAVAVVVPDGELPAAPTGLKGVSTSAPGAEDGAIKGTTTKMEFSAAANFTKAYDCDDKITEGLAAGTYFVRYMADPATGIAASNAAAVVIEDGQERVSDLFTDVSDNSFCADAVLWAVKNGITNGATATTFAPGSSCTRAQVVTFLWRAAGSPKPRAAANPFTDVKVGAYYYDAVLWAVENGITQGMNATTFGTNKSVTRGQFVTFLCRSQKGAASAKNTVFTDVLASAYYADAVAWAVENGVTTGLTATTFGPSRTCNRGQVVTFLYRCFVK